MAEDFVRELNRELQQWRHDLAASQWQIDTNGSRAAREHHDKLQVDYLSWRARRVKIGAKFDLSSVSARVARQVKEFLVTDAPTDITVARYV